MSLKNKILISISVLIITMLIIPIFFVNFAPEDTGMALCFISFFVINPIVVIILSIIARSDIRKLWWIPLLASILFPVFFAVAVGEIVIDLFLYSAIYLCIGAVTVSASFIIKIKCFLKSKKH